MKIESQPDNHSPLCEDFVNSYGIRNKLPILFVNGYLKDDDCKNILFNLVCGGRLEDILIYSNHTDLLINDSNLECLKKDKSITEKLKFIEKERGHYIIRGPLNEIIAFLSNYAKK